MHQISKTSSEINIADQTLFYELKRPQEWADSIASHSVISALIFGFSAAVLTNVTAPSHNDKQHYFTAFIILLACSSGLAFIGLAVTSIMYHNIKGFRAYRLDKALLIYEKKSYLIKNLAYYSIYISWALLIIAIIMYVWAEFDQFVAKICTIITAICLFMGISIGVYLANIYAKFNGDGNILHVLSPERNNEIMDHAETIVQLQNTNVL